MRCYTCVQRLAQKEKEQERAKETNILEPSPLGRGQGEGDTSYPAPHVAWYAVAVLLLAYTSSMIDRVIISYLVGPIKKTFGVTDSHMSLLMGIAFTLFYTLLGLPIGRLADTSTRRTVIAIGVALWSLATAWCGMAKSFVQLFVGRVAVGVGEATLSPSAYSLIADFFPVEKRTTAMSVYSMGISIGNGTAVILAGSIAGFAASAGMIQLPIVGEIFPWQYIFFVVGLPGLLIALLLFTVKEPKRQGIPAAGQGTARVRTRDVIAFLRQHRATAIAHTLGFSMFSIFNQGIGFWFPEFFIRTYAWKRADIGLWQGATSVVFGTLGLYAGSRIAAYFLKRGQVDANLRVMLIAAACLLPISLVMFQMPTGSLAAPFFIGTAFFGFMPYGAATAAIQQLMPNQMRGTASAMFLFTINLFGGGTGPFLVSSFTNYVFRDDAMLRYSMSIVTVVSLGAAVVLYVFGMKYFRASMTR
jgi:MFS family permease